MGEKLSSKKKTSGAADQTAKDDVALPKLGFLGMLRWIWTQLTSMRTALFLLLMVAVASVPGSIFPQRIQSTAVVAKYIQDNPVSGPIMDWFQLFDVFESSWFSAIYILLFISLIGCVVPRARQHYKAMRSVPPRTPARLSRLPEYGTLQIPAAAGLSAQAAIEDARAILKKRGYRVDVRDGDRPSVGAERGFLKEIGNLVFHVSLIGVLVAVAIGGLFGFSYQRVLVTGDTVVNNLASIDQFTKGTNFDPNWLQPFSVQLDKFDVQFDRNSTSRKVQPLDFTAYLTVKDSPEAQPQQKILKVNEPLEVANTSLYLLGNGYAPHFTVKDGNGNVAFSDFVVARLQDPDFTSSVVIKVPDAKPDQLSFSGLFLPTAFQGADGVDISIDPDPGNPKVLLNSYYGDLGLDNGQPQNVFVLDASKLKPLNDRKLPAGGISLSGGQTYQLPEGKGSITFDGLTRYAGIEVRSNPAQQYVLLFSVTAVIGLLGSLFLSRRRIWVRTGEHPDGRVMVEYGLLARGEDYRLSSEASGLRNQLVKTWNISENSEQDERAGAEDATAAEDPKAKED